MNPFLDRTMPVEINNSGNLPHWHQDGKIQFITFRLADSLPQSKICELRLMITKFNKEHPKPWDKATAIRYQNMLGHAEEKLLDNGYGSCILQYAEFRQIIILSLRYYSQQFYDMVAFVIMPNHLHALLRFYTGTKTEKILHSIKSYTAHKINMKLHHTGSIWMKEYFDRIVRSEENLQKYIEYIENNPKHLPPEKFDLYINPVYKR